MHGFSKPSENLCSLKGIIASVNSISTDSTLLMKNFFAPGHTYTKDKMLFSSVSAVG